MGYSTTGIPPDFRAGSFVMCKRIIRIAKLVKNHALALAAHLLGKVA